MTYYEELGVRAEASAEEIRRAYKMLARVLHPDQQADEGVKRICEGQLKRLNGMMEVLLEEGRRREYDRELRRAGARRGRRELPVGSTGMWVWLGAVTVSAGIMAWYFGRNEAGAEGAAAVAQKVVDAGQKPGGGAEAPAHKQRQKPRRRVAQKKELAPVEVKEEEEPSGVIEEREPAAAPVAVAPVAVGPYYAGAWYLPDGEPAAGPGMYGAETLEVVVEESGGVVNGRFRGRYRVTDRAISPEVSFEFSGAAGGAEEATFGWRGPGGARGQIRLRRRTAETMEVSWWASELGELGLASGTAVVVRLRKE